MAVQSSGRRVGRCAKDGSPASIRLQLVDDPGIRAALCHECFHLHAVMRAKDARAYSMIRTAAQRIAGTIWRADGEFFLLRSVAGTAAGLRCPVLRPTAPPELDPVRVDRAGDPHVFHRWAPGAN